MIHTYLGHIWDVFKISLRTRWEHLVPIWSFSNSDIPELNLCYFSQNPHRCVTHPSQAGANTSQVSSVMTLVLSTEVCLPTGFLSVPDPKPLGLRGISMEDNDTKLLFFFIFSQVADFLWRFFLFDTWLIAWFVDRSWLKHL